VTPGIYKPLLLKMKSELQMQLVIRAHSVPGIIPDSKNNFNFERPQSWNDFWQFWGLFETEQPPNSQIILQPACQLPCGPQKSTSGLKLTVWLLQPPFNSFEIDT